jgi:hypothetical protein
MKTTKPVRIMVWMWILYFFNTINFTAGLRCCSPLARVKVCIDGVEGRRVRCDQEHGSCVEAGWIVISKTSSEFSKCTYPERQAPMVCVRHPMVSRMPHAFQIKYGATPHVQMNCHTTLGHHSHPMPKSLSCSTKVAPRIPVPGRPNDG